MSDHDGVEQVITMAWRAHCRMSRKDACDDKPAPLLFEAALSMRGKCFTLDSEGEASLLLQVPE